MRCTEIYFLVQGTKVEGTIAELFEGHMHMFIECINVDYKSTRRESFMDLQLDVKGCKNIYDSFDKYCEVEVMDGQNQYKTDDHGLRARNLPVPPSCSEFPPPLSIRPYKIAKLIIVATGYIGALHAGRPERCFV